MACWIVAKNAQQYIIKQSPTFSGTFKIYDIPTTAYHIQAGFDESLIESGICYLEQIHIFLEVDVIESRGADTLLSALGKICSPFSSILFTDSGCDRLPLYKEDGSICEWEELVFLGGTKMADAGTSAKIPLSAIICSMSPHLSDRVTGFNSYGPGTSSSRSTGKGRDQESDKGKGSGEGGNDNNNDERDNHQSPTEVLSERPGGKTVRKAEISFEIASHIHPSETLPCLQTINVQGEFSIETTPMAPDPPQFSTRRVNFKELTFGTELYSVSDVSYRQFYARIAIDSKQRHARVRDVHPKRSTYYQGEETVTSSSSTSRGASGSLSAGFGLGTSGPQGSVFGSVSRSANEESVSVEQTRARSGISEQRHNGSIWWGFQIGDIKVQTEGFDMPEIILPNVLFDYVGDNEVPKDPPEDIDVVVSSFWSMIPAKKPDGAWIKLLLNRFKSAAQQTKTTTYSNLFNVVVMEIGLASEESQKKPGTSHYQAQVRVKSGMTESIEVERSPDKQVKVDLDTVNDLKNLKKFKIPMVADVVEYPLRHGISLVNAMHRVSRSAPTSENL